MKPVRLFEQFISEGRRSKYDGLASTLVTQVFKKWVKDFKAGKKSSSYITSIEDARILFDLEATIYFGETNGFAILKSTGADGGTTDKEGDYQDPYIIIDFAVNPEWLPGEWSEVYMYLSDVMRHEIEHITQDGEDIGNYKMGKPNEDDSMLRFYIESGLLPDVSYLTLPKEIDANLQGLRFEAKKRRISMIDSINKYLDTQPYLKDDPKSREMVIDTWRRRASKIGGIPKF